jgi:hypothetical protein
MISSQFLIITGIITALLWIPAGIRLYKEAVPIQWLFAAAFIFGSLGISCFYYEVSYGLFGGFINLFIVSRYLWALVLLTTALLAISVMVYRR